MKAQTKRSLGIHTLQPLEHSSQGVRSLQSATGTLHWSAQQSKRSGAPLWLRAFVAKNTKSLVFFGASHQLSSLPFNRAWGFGGDVVDDAVDAGDFVDDACGGAAQEFHVVMVEISSHAVD